MRVLIPGIASALGRLVTSRLLRSGHEVIGIDRRPWPGAPGNVILYRLDIRKRAAEEVFRRHRPQAVIHMATVTHLTERSADRYRINLQGTRAVFEYSQAHGVKHAILVGRHTFYGAAPDSPLYHTEDEPPMSIAVFPELADLVAADLFAGSALWRYPGLTTTVLRICYTLGPSGRGTLASFLRGKYIPAVLGFDPLFQFMHEHDEATAICLTLEHGIRGVYNVAGPAPLPLSLVVKQAGRHRIPLPESLFRLSLGRFGLPGLPRGAVSHIKYPVVVDATAFRKATAFEPEHDELATLRIFRQTYPAIGPAAVADPTAGAL